MFSSLGLEACRGFFVERPSERIDFGLVFSHCWRASGQAECIVDSELEAWSSC